MMMGTTRQVAARALVALTLAVAGLATATAAPVGAQTGEPSFTSSALSGHSSTNPTSLQFGPDGKLYVAEVSGIVNIYEIEQLGPDDYQVVGTETIGRVAQITNHDDDGSVMTNANYFGVRQVTGLLVTGTAQDPVLYVSSSDPRIGGPGEDLPLDTNSGIVSRLTQTTPGSWAGAAKLDIVRGLPRNEENHSINGMEISADGSTLYLTAGGHTNQGAPSNSFAFQWEYALSAAILALDLPAIDALPLQPPGCDPTVDDDCHLYDLPTLDDPTRSNVGGEDVNDPFGGNSAAGGANQAVLDPSGPVQLHATGFRNPYDVVITTDGRMMTIDNGPNAGWGGEPAGEGPAGVCDNTVDNAGAAGEDSLHYVRELSPGEMYYGGHASPVRGNPAGVLAQTQSTAVPWSGSPIPAGFENPVECDYRGPFSNGSGFDNGAIETWDHSTNGIAEYTASSFGGAMQGDILAAGWTTGHIVRAKVAYDGADNPSLVLSEELLSTGGAALDVVARGDEESFPGTIWAANFYGGPGPIIVFEPDDSVTCGGPPGADDDGDGFTNQDEVDNGTDPCSAASLPPDNDGDGISDLNDDDDDNDGLPDVDDPFAIDATNGLSATVPTVFEWEVPTSGIAGLGFTGLMTNGAQAWHELYDPAAMTAIGAAGVFTIDAINAGDALGGANDQEHAFQLGVDTCGTCAPYRITSQMSQPLQNIGARSTQSMGIFAGTGDQSNYVKAVVTPGPDATGGIQLLVEESDVVTADVFTPAPELLTGSLVTVSLDIDPIAGTATASYQVDGGPETAAGGPVSVPTSWSTSAATAAGIIATSAGAPDFTGTWNRFAVVAAPNPGTGSWTQLADHADARHENSFVELNGLLYLIGGRDVNPVEIYDPATDTWSTGAPTPVEMHHFQAVVHDDLIHVIGAMTGDFPDEVPIDRVYIYDPYDDRWIEGPAIPASRSRGSSGVAVHDDLIYVVGGIQEGHTTGTVGWVDVYDPITGTWTPLPNDMPNPRDHVSAAVVGDELYMVGGRVTEDDLFDSTVDVVDVLDLATGTWSTLADPIPTPRAAAATAAFGTDIVVFGGESGAQSDAHGETEALDTLTGTWRSLEPMPAGLDRHGTSAVVLGCRIYAAAGSGAQGGSPELSSTVAFEFSSCNLPTAPTGTLTAPASLDFGTVGVGSSSTIDALIQNPGTEPVAISSARVVGSDAGAFAVTVGLPVQVPAGGSTTIGVDFQPTVTGAVGAPADFGDTAAALALGHDGANSAVTIPLTGTGGTGPGETPIAGLSVSVTDAVVLGGSITATASVSAGTNVTYDWDFGDGTSLADAGPTVQHTYGATGSYTVEVVATNTVSSATASDTTAVIDAPSGGDVLVNVGGGTYTDSAGREWSEDPGATGGSTFADDVAIAGTLDDVVYQSERYGDFAYALPVDGPGCYSVVLHFAEIWWGGVGGGGDGDRVFDVSIEGSTVLSGYDIHADVGYATAATRSFLTETADSVLDIGFVTVVDNAKVSGIEVTSVGASCAPDDPITGLSVVGDGPTTLASATNLTASITGGTNVSYDWDLGDGTTLTDGGASVSHTYASAGSYTATVTASNGVSSASASVPVTVVTPPLISIVHTSTAEGDEGSKFVDITVSLSHPSPTPVTVDFASVGNPAEPTIAIPGVDYASTSGTVTFAPGETTQIVPVEVYGDRIDEPPHLYGEWALLSFSNPSANAVLDTSFFGLGVVIIVDDDPPPVISILSSIVTEGDIGSTSVDLTVSLSNPSATTVTVDYASLSVPTLPAVAVPGVDFAATSGSVTFAPGETEKFVTVEVFGDTIVEPPLLYGEWAVLSFSNASANAVLDTSFFGFGVVIIVDDDV